MTPNHCIHYNGIRGEEPLCKIGVDVRASFHPCWPCWTGNQVPASSATCEQFVAPTPEQLAAAEKESEIRVEMMFTALLAVEKWEASLPRDRLSAIGQIDCPCCGKPQVLATKFDRYHLYVKCKTEGCVEFRGNRRR